MIKQLIQSFKIYKHIKYLSDSSELHLSKNVVIVCKKNSIIEISGLVRIGYPLPKADDLNYSTKEKTKIFMSENSKLIFKGNTFINAGGTIKIGKNAELIFEGDNQIGHDAIILCSNKITFGKGACASWNFQCIDDDGHTFYSANGKKIRRIKKELKIGDNAGIQMNVSIPSAISIGENTIIAGGTILRQDVPANVLAYSTSNLVIKENITTGFQFENNE